MDFQHWGDLSQLSPSHAEMISAILKEALTNASRHSQATRVVVNREVRDNIVRLLIRDNGVGCEKIKEGMGLSGMRERVSNLGKLRDGFMIVAILPREEGELLREC